MSENNSPYSPTSLVYLPKPVISESEKWLLSADAIIRVKKMITALNFYGEQERSEIWSTRIIETISKEEMLTITYNEWDKEECNTPRHIVPLALYRANKIPSDEIFKKLWNWRFETQITHKPHPHLKLDAFQVGGFSQTEERGFKTFDLDKILTLRSSLVLPEEDDIREIDERFTLDNMHWVDYVLQYSQLRLQKYRDQLLALLPKK